MVTPLIAAFMVVLRRCALVVSGFTLASVAEGTNGLSAGCLLVKEADERTDVSWIPTA